MRSEQPRPNLDQIDAAQADYDADVAKKQAEAERTQSMQGESKEGVRERQGLIGEAEALQKDVDIMKAQKIEERSANAQKLKESEGEKQLKIAELKGNIDEVKTYIASIEARTQGKEMAPVVKEAFRAAQEELKKLEGEGDVVFKNLGEIQALQVSQKDIEKYLDLQKGLDSVNKKIDEISSNVFVIESLQEEALGEERIRYSVIKEAMRKLNFYGGTGEREKFSREVAETYLTEKFKAKGLSNIVDGDARLAAMSELARAMLKGINDDSLNAAWQTKDDKERAGRFSGGALKNVIGAHGTPASTLQWLSQAEGLPLIRDNVTPEQSKDAINKGIEHHLGTLNLLRSHKEVEKVSPFTSGDWNTGFDRDRAFLNSKFTVSPEGAIVPKEADPATLEKIKTEFGGNRERAQAIQENLAAKERGRLEKETTEARKTLEALQANLRAAQDAEKIAKEVLPQWNGGIGHLREMQTKITNGLGEKRAKKDEVVEKLRKDREEKGKKGFLGRTFGSGDIDNSIKYNETAIGNVTRNIETDDATLRKLDTALEGLANGDVYSIQQKIESAQKTLQGLEQKIARLNA